MTSRYQELPRCEDDDEKPRYTREFVGYSEKAEEEFAPDLKEATSQITPTSNEKDEVKPINEKKCAHGSFKNVSILELPDCCILERQRCFYFGLWLLMFWMTAMVITKMLFNAYLRGDNGMECSQIGRVSGFPAIGCVKWENRTESAWKVGNIAGDLLEVQHSMLDRLSEHGYAMNGHMDIVDAAVKTITVSLDDESADLALIRSFLSKNEDGEMSCDLLCAGLVAQHIQKQELGLGSGPEAVRTLVTQLEAVDLEMAAYSAFLEEVEVKIAVLVDKLKPATLTWNDSAETASAENTVQPLNGPRSILATGIFKTTEFLVRNSETELRDIIVESKFISISISVCLAEAAVNEQQHTPARPYPTQCKRSCSRIASQLSLPDMMMKRCISAFMMSRSYQEGRCLLKLRA